MRVICMGDSITAGQHLDEGDAAWPAHLRNVHAYARGVPGDTTRLALERWPRDVQIHEADVVVIQFGHNDANRWTSDRGLPRVSADAYAANLHEMIDRVQTFGAVPVLCELTPSLRPDPHPGDCLIYNALLRTVAATRRVTVARTSTLTEAHLLDGLHLTADGHIAYAELVQAVLPWS